MCFLTNERFCRRIRTPCLGGGLVEREGVPTCEVVRRLAEAGARRKQACMTLAYPGPLPSLAGSLWRLLEWEIDASAHDERVICIRQTVAAVSCLVVPYRTISRERRAALS